MLTYKRCEVMRSETTVFCVDVVPWEVALLAAVNGSDVVQVKGDVPTNKPFPGAGYEYDRLATKYGIDKEGSGQEFVALVYGVGSRGVEAIAAEIAKAADAASAAKGRTVPDTAIPTGDTGLAEDFDPTAELFANRPAMVEGASAIVE